MKSLLQGLGKSLWLRLIAICRRLPYGVRHRLGSRVFRRLPYQLVDLGFNGRIIIEPTSACNLGCPLCPAGAGLKRRSGMMRLEEYQAIVDQVSGLVCHISMNFAGEPFLNKNLLSMVRYAKEKGIGTMVSTNSTLLDRHLDDIFTCGLETLVVCLDGASPATHEAYRIGSRFEDVVRQIRLVCAERRRRGLRKPGIALQFIVMKQNEHEVDRIIQLGRDLGVDRVHLKTISLGSRLDFYERIRRAETYLPSNDRLRRYAVNGGEIEMKDRPLVCPWLRQSVILWNGDVTMCCYDFEGEMVVGNLFRDGGFRQLWESVAYKKARLRVLRQEFELCKTCARTREYGVSIDLRRDGAIGETEIF